MGEQLSEESSLSPSTQRVVVYLSGGGYRAAFAAIGALSALAVTGHWGDVRKIVSVSGGGILNGWLATQRPDSAAELLTALEELAERLRDRRRSRRNLLLAATVPAIVLALSLASCVLLWIYSGWVLALFVALPIGLTVTLGSTLSLAPRVFLARDYDFLRWPAGDLGGVRWYREHVFVASDLLWSGSISFVCHRQGSLVRSRKRGQFDADAISLSDMLRASTALPPLLPAVRLTLRRAVDPSAELGAEPESDPEVVWFVDGGATGNLGIQLDPGLSGLVDMADDKYAIHRDSVALSGEHGSAADQIAELDRRVDELGREIERAHAELEGAAARREVRAQRREAREAFWESPEGVAAKEKAAQHPSVTAKFAAAGDAQKRGATSDEVRQLLLEAVQAQVTLREEIAADLFPAVEPDPVAEVLDRPAERLPQQAQVPDCGHDPLIWSECTECITESVIVDASGLDRRSNPVFLAAMRVPILGTIINAARTLKIQYEDNLQDDLLRSRDDAVRVTRPDDIYWAAAGVERSTSALQRVARWGLEKNLRDSMAASLPVTEYIHAELCKLGSTVKTGLTAPKTERGRIAVDAVMASAFVGTLVRTARFGSGASQKTVTLSADHLLRAVSELPPALKHSIAGRVEDKLAEHAKMREDAENLRRDYLRVFGLLSRKRQRELALIRERATGTTSSSYENGNAGSV